MAIGSSPEIGTKFTTWGLMDEGSRESWFNHVRNDWGPNLVNGYGTLVIIERTPVDEKKKLSNPNVEAAIRNGMDPDLALHVWGTDPDAEEPYDD